MLFDRELQGCSVVLLGDFNPKIFQPFWLVANGIEDDEDQGEVDVIHRDLAVLKFEASIYNVQANRFSLESSVTPEIKVADKVRQIFGEHLIHTPIRALGVNRTAHFSVGSLDQRTKLGRKICPLSPWGIFGESMDTEDPQNIGGLKSLTMKSLEDIDGLRVETNAKIEPSARLAGGSGVYMEINRHFNLNSGKEPQGATQAMQVLDDHFEKSITISDEIIEQIMSEVD